MLILVAIFLHDRLAKTTTDEFYDEVDSQRRRRMAGPFSPLGYTLAQLVCLTIALSLSVVAFSVTSPVDVGLLAYMLLLAGVRLICGNGRWGTRCYHHLNLLGVVAIVFSIVQVGLPFVMLDPRATYSGIEIAKLIFEVATVFVAFIKPRPYQKQMSKIEGGFQQESSSPSPEETCSWFSYYCSYEWMTYLIFRGCRRDLHMSDLPPLPRLRRAVALAGKNDVSTFKTGQDIYYPL